MSYTNTFEHYGRTVYVYSLPDRTRYTATPCAEAAIPWSNLRVNPVIDTPCIWASKHSHEGLREHAKLAAYRADAATIYTQITRPYYYVSCLCEWYTDELWGEMESFARAMDELFERYDYEQRMSAARQEADAKAARRYNYPHARDYDEDPPTYEELKASGAL